MSTAPSARSRAAAACSAGSNILVLGSDARTGDSIDESPGRPRPRRHDHARPRRLRRACASCRSRATSRSSIPGHGVQQDQRRLRARRAGADDPDASRTSSATASRSTTWSRSTSRTSRDFIDALGGVTVNNKTRICSPPFDNFWKGLHFKQGRDPPRRRRARSATRACARTACAPDRGRPRPRARASRRCCAAIGAQAKSPEHVLPAALGELAGAQHAQVPT